MAQQVHHLSLGPLIAHAFNADRSQVAVSPNSHEVHIYKRQDQQTWTLTHTLSEHDKLVTGIDWAPNSNRIVTCSQDRNAYVWTLTPDGAGGEVWKPTLVLLRLNRAATFVRWSPNEDKFAVASGARIIAICSFEEDNDWWVAKHIKKPLRSTILSIDWHPNNVLIAAGSADMKARVFSAFIKGIDSKPPPSVWGERLPFGTVCAEYRTPSGGWVHSVAFSPSGDALAFVGHDSSLSIAYPSGPDAPPQAIHVIRSASLPNVTLTFLTENEIVAAGHGCQPILFEGDIEKGWKATKTLDTAGAAAGKAAPPPPPKAPGLAASSVGRLNNEAFNRFKSADARGAGAASSTASAGLGGGALGAVAGASVSSDGELHTTHQNTITSVRPYEGTRGAYTSVSTSGVDGRLCVFSASAGAPLVKAMSGLKV